MKNPLEVKFYFAYTSPVSYLAKDPAYALERSHDVSVRYIPYGVDIRRVYGDVPTRGERDRRKLRYLYHDARRMARERGAVIYPPKRIFSARLAFYGGFCAEDQSLFMRKNKIAAHVGFSLVKIKQDPERGHVKIVSVEFHPFYDRGFYEKRF